MILKAKEAIIDGAMKNIRNSLEVAWLNGYKHGVADRTDVIIDPKFKHVLDEVIERPPTNADKIRTMTDEELAEMMVYKDCPTIEMSLFKCPEKYCPDGETHDCHQCWLDWLKQEVSDAGT